MKAFKFVFILLLLCLPKQVLPNDSLKVDSIHISLLTCAPGQPIYSLFGHTAIRCHNLQTGQDLVFNYGMFQFNTPHFILRFALGQTDYMLGVQDYTSFQEEYFETGRSVWEQTLNLTSEEKLKLINILQTNSLPQNRVYRYNFFYDNCATRPRDRIEDCIKGGLLYPHLMPTGGHKSFRDIIHEYTKGHPWAQFGIDLCVGSQADKPITERQMMFAPFYLKNAFEKALMPTDRQTRLVISTNKIVDCEAGGVKAHSKDFWDIATPFRCALLVFIITLCICLYSIKRQKALWGFDVALFASAGIVGCVLAFLALFSVHPAVSPNYLLFVFHPLQLLCIPFIIRAALKHKRSDYHLLNAIVLTLFILFFALLPQKFDLAIVPLALSLLARSASNIIITYKKKA